MTDLEFWKQAMPMGNVEEHVSALPEHMRRPVTSYIVNGIQGGGFLTTLLSGAPVWQVLGAADEENQRSLMAWARLIYSACPRGAYGSGENVERWIERGGLRGVMDSTSKGETE